MKKPPLVEVRWLDAVHRDGSVSLEDAAGDGLAERMTVGFLVNQTPDKTILAMTYDLPTKNCGVEVDGRFTIPTAWIVKLRYIERRPKQPKEKPTT